MFCDVACAFEVPGVAYDESVFEVFLLHDFFSFNDVFLGGLRCFFDVYLVREDAVFEAVFAGDF